MKKTLFIFAIITTIFSSCKKYEEDGFISLRTAKARLCHTWKVEKATDDGKDVTSFFNDYNYRISFDKSGTCNISVKFGGVGFGVNGKWEFIENQQSIKITMDQNQFNVSDGTWKIRKLYKGELWVVNGDDEMNLTRVD
jgi:hypothetical protein